METEINKLKKIISKKNYKRILIISGKKSFFYSGAQKLCNKIIDKNQKELFSYFKKSSFPEIDELKRIILFIKKVNPDLIFAIGGGSVLDYAKIANSLAYSPSIKRDILNGSSKNLKKFCPLLAIPTTAGSGAEITPNAVIYIGKIKYSVESNILRPDYNFLIPELVIGNSKKLKSSAGFDAISQAIESLISRKSTGQSVNFAMESLKISLKNYLYFVKKPTLNNSFNMIKAAHLSGKAIAISKTTAPHALSYPFTAHWGVSHGHAVSLTLNDFLIFNYKNIHKSDCNFDLKKRFEKIFSVTKTRNIIELNDYLNKIKSEANLNQDFNRFGINLDKNYSKIIDGVNIQRLSNNPIKLTKKDIRAILLKKII